MRTPFARSEAAASILTRPGPISPIAGDCGFVHDPDALAGDEPAIWLPEYSPATLILQSAAAGYGLGDTGGTFDPSALGTVLADRIDADGRELMIGNAAGALHLWLRGQADARRPTVVLPVDGAFKTSLDVVLRFIRRLHGQHVNLLPPALRITPFQRKRLIQFLHAYDVHEAGGTARDVAIEVLGAAQASLPASEWKDSAARRRATRLVENAVAHVNRDYLKILRGE